MKQPEDALRRSEERFRIAQELSLDAFTILSAVRDDQGIIRDFQCEFANPAAGRLLGHTPEELIDKRLLQILPSIRMQSDLFDRFVRVLQTGEPHDYELYYGWDGLKGWFRNMAVRLGDGVAVCFADITARKQAEDELRASKERFELAVRGAGVGIWDWNIRTGKVYYSPRWKTIFGYAENEIGDGFDDWARLLHPEEAEYVCKYQADFLAGTGSSVTLEYRLRHKDGLYRWIEAHAVVVRDEHGEACRLVGSHGDITARKQAELRYQDLFENIPVGVGIATYEGRLLACNTAMLQILGCGAGETERITLEDTYVDRTRRVELLQRIRTDGKVRDFEVELKRKDGARYWASLTVVPLRWDGQEVLLTVQVDVSGRKRAEQALQESENKYRTLVESAGETIAVVNEEGFFLFMNTTAAVRLGGKPEEYVGKTMWELFPREIADRQVASIRTVIRTGRGMNVIVPTTVQGTTRWYNTTIEPLSDAKGEIRSALIVGRDIHELRQAQKELEEYRIHMARAERLASLGTLSATVAHEMNQPLTVIQLTIQNCLAQLEEEGSVQGLVGDLKDCLEEVSVVTSIVDRFKGFARYSLRRGGGRTNLQGVAERMVSVLEDAAKRRRVRLVLEGLDRLGELDADERDMGQVFFSLIENAIQAADGKTDHQLLITGRASGASVEVRFADDCGGIAPEHVDKIFDPFFTTKSDNEGTGLGLCIVEQALSRVGGRIRVENRPGEGVTFIITLLLQDKK